MAGRGCGVGGVALARWGPPRFSPAEERAAVGGCSRLPAGLAAGLAGDVGPRLPRAFSAGVDGGTVSHFCLVSVFICIFNDSSPGTTALYGR